MTAATRLSSARSRAPTPSTSSRPIFTASTGNSRRWENERKLRPKPAMQSSTPSDRIAPNAADQARGSSSSDPLGYLEPEAGGGQAVTGTQRGGDLRRQGGVARLIQPPQQAGIEAHRYGQQPGVAHRAAPDRQQPARLGQRDERHDRGRWRRRGARRRARRAAPRRAGSRAWLRHCTPGRGAARRPSADCSRRCRCPPSSPRPSPPRRCPVTGWGATTRTLPNGCRRAVAASPPLGASHQPTRGRQRASPAYLGQDHRR